MRLTHPNLR